MRGVFVATVTPFDARGGVDFDAFTSHLNFLADSGVQGFTPCGTTGESPVLSADERAELIRISVEIARVRNLKVIAGCGSNDTRSAEKMIEAAAKAGCDAVLVVTPYYNRPTQNGLIAHYTHLANSSALPIFLYHVPGRTQVTFTIDTVKTLLQHPRILGLKEASGQHGFWMSLATQIDWREKLLMAGDDDAFATLYALGAGGIISASANLVPQHFVELFNLLETGQAKEAFLLQRKLFPLVQALFAETSPAPVKWALQRLRAMEPHLRLPLVPISEKTEVQVASAMERLELGVRK